MTFVKKTTLRACVMNVGKIEQKHIGKRGKTPMARIALFTQESQKQQRRMKKQFDEGQITEDVFSEFMTKKLEDGHKRWKGYKP